jgi:Xaa-Pro aminopeptidase
MRASRTNADVVKRRVKAVRDRLDRNRLDGLIVARPANVTYLTGFSGHDAWAVVTGYSLYLITDSRYLELARKQCTQSTIVERKGPMIDAVARLLDRLKSVATVGIESTVSIAGFRTLNKGVRARLRPIGGTVEEIRSTKDRSEIRALRAAASIAAKALDQTRRHFRPGITERELAALLDLEISRLGAERSFETIVAFGANASRPHHQPTCRALQQKDTLLIDFGARYDGYCSDITRCFTMGKPSKAYRRAYEAVERAQAAAIGIARAGARLAELDAAPRDVLRTAGLPVYRYGTGHGVGLEVHEQPSLRNNGDGKLKAGQIITIEPGVYIPGKFGIRIEDDILITETGCEVITGQCPHTPLPE